mgnify:CR=1 FL=1
MANGSNNTASIGFEEQIWAAADILRDPGRQARMKQGMAQLGIPDAAERIYETVMALVR